MLKKILLVEDEKDIRDSLKKSLTENNYLVETAEDGAAALMMVDKISPDMVILDLGLPKISGESVLQEIKKNYPNMPIIILSAKSTTSDIVSGLNLGADNYIAKPFMIEELLARIKAQFKTMGNDIIKLKVADLELDNDSKEVRRAGKLIQLTPKEFELLYHLMSNVGRVLSRETILNKVWLYSPDIESRVVDVYIGYLRRKIDHRQRKKLILSIRGFGYSIKP
jgi:Response regulators consisting of a CheY-like receiver domain and a winged-helix DNA-binding domain